MQILWLNWKDIKHPEAGGAERYTHEIAKRLVSYGHTVTLFTSYFRGAKKKEEIDGINIIRKGKIVGLFDTVFSHAKRFYVDHEKEFDIIIDEINTRPFMTPNYVRKPIIALIHQLAVEFWDYRIPFPLNLVGRYILEPYWLKKYLKIRTITVSQSTKKDLIHLGFKDIKIIYNGLDKNVLQFVPNKNDTFTVSFLGRLSPTKKPEDAIKAYISFNKGRLYIIGKGILLKKLQRKYDFEKNILFMGYLPEKEKNKLIQRTHVVLVPGIREGWGRVVIESNAMGTPVIGYNIPGLRDSIKNYYNGLLCKPNPKNMSELLNLLYEDRSLLRKLSENALIWAKQFNWDESAIKFESILYETIQKRFMYK